MKRYLLPLLVFVSLIFAGFNNANATLTIGTATTATTISLTTASGTTNAEQIVSFSATATGGTDDIFYQFNFTSTNPPGNNFTNFKLLVNNVNSITGAVNDNATFTGTGTNAITVTTPENENFGTLPYDEVYAGAPLYYFIVADYTASATETFQVSLTTLYYQTATQYFFGGTSSTSKTILGNTFVCNPPPTTTATNITAGLSPAAGSNIYYGQSGLAVVETSFNTNTATTPITQLVYTVSPSLTLANNYFSNVPQLYSSTSATFTGTPTPTAVTGAGAPVLNTTNNTITFNITGTTVGTGTTYYYLVLNYSVNGVTLPQPFTFRLSGYTTGYSGAVTTTTALFPANTYTCTAPSLTVATNTGGLAATTITGNEAGIAIFSISAKSVGTTASITSFTFTTSAGQIIANYFPTVTLYSSTSATYGTGTFTSLGVQTPAAGATSVTFPVTQSIATGVTTYYYLVVSYTETSSTPPPAFQFNLTTVASTPTATLSSTTGQSYTFTLGTYSWNGSVSNAWNTAANWTPNVVPGPYDIAQVGGPNNTLYYNYYPTVSTPTVTVGSISFNENEGYEGYLIVNTGSTLVVNGDISLTGDKELAKYYTIDQIAFEGGGTIQAKDLNVNASYVYGTGTAYNYNLEVDNLGVTLVLSANINLTSNVDAADAPYSPYYYMEGGITTVNGQIVTSNTTSYTGTYSTSILGFNALTATVPATLQLANANALSLSSTGTNTLLFNVNYGTVEYSGAAQTVYTNKAITGLTTGPTYYSLKFSGTGAKTPNSTTSGSTITGALYVGGDFTNTLTNDASNYLALTTSATSSLGTPVVFNGSNVAENLYGGAGTGTIFRNVSFSNTKTATMQTGSFSVIDLGTLTMLGTTTANILNTGTGLLTLNSDATGTATIATIPTGPTIQGTLNIQRYVTGNSNYSFRGYRYFASPVNKITYVPSSTSTSPNVLDLSYFGATVNGNYGAYFGGPGSGFSKPINNSIIYLYDEALIPGSAINSTFYSSNYVGIYGYTPGSPWYVTTKSLATGGQTTKDNSLSVVIPAGNGLLYYYIGNSQQPSVSPSNAPASSTMTATGYVNQGTFPLYLWGVGGSALTSSFSYTSANVAPYQTDPPGTFLLGNPYPATMDLHKLWSDNYSATAGAATFNTPITFHQLDIVSQNYDDYNTNGTSSGGNTYEYVVEGQGFLMSLPAASSKPLYFYEDQKVLYAAATYPTQINEAILPPKIVNDLVVTATQSSNPISTFNNQPHNLNLVNPSVNTLSLVPVNQVTPLKNNPAVPGLKPTVTPPPVINVTPPSQTTITPPIVAVVDSIAGAPVCGLHLKLVQDSVHYDQCGVYFNKTWSDNFDTNDSKDLDGYGGKVFLSSYSNDDVRTSINALSSYTNNRRVKLYAKFTTAGIYMLQLQDIKGVDTQNYSVFLLDNLKSDSLDLTLYKSYNFNYAPGTANDSTRFVLAIEHKPVPYYALLTFAGQKVTQGVQLNWTVKNEFNTTKFVLQKLGANNTYAFLDSLQSDSSSIYDYVDQHPTLGNNTYRLQQTTALGVITYSAPVTIGYNSTSPNGGLNIYPNPAKTSITVTLTTASTATQVATADIYNTSGTLIEHTAVNSNSFTHDVSSYQLGVYIIELKNSNGLLVGKSKFVKVQ